MTRSPRSIPFIFVAPMAILLAILVSASVLRAQPEAAAGGRVQFESSGGGRGARGAAATNPALAPDARGGGRGGVGARGPLVPIAAVGDGPTCALDATVYDVRVAPDQIGRIDMTALARAAAAPDAFERALADLGTTRPLYRINQSVRLAGDSITIGTQTPYITGSVANRAGGVTNSVSYASTGAVLGVTGKPSASGRIELDLTIQISSLSESPTEIGLGARAQLFRTAAMSHKGMVQPRDPFVVVSVDASTMDANGKAVAYVARIALGDPQSGAGPGRGE